MNGRHEWYKVRYGGPLNLRVEGPFAGSQAGPSNDRAFPETEDCATVEPDDSIRNWVYRRAHRYNGMGVSAIVYVVHDCTDSDTYILDDVHDAVFRYLEATRVSGPKEPC